MTFRILDIQQLSDDSLIVCGSARTSPKKKRGTKPTKKKATQKKRKVKRPKRRKR